MNRVDEFDRRKFVDLFALAVLTQLPTFQVGASESTGVNGPEITAKVYRTLKHLSVFPKAKHLRQISIPQVYLDFFISGRTKALENEKWEKV